MNHVWIVQAYIPDEGRWANYLIAQSRAEARELQRTTSLQTRIRKFVAEE